MKRTDLGGIYLSVISAHRASNVPSMQSLVGNATWYVPSSQISEYEAAGAARVRAADALCEARNAALDDAHSEGLACVQLSDDLKKLQVVSSESEARNVEFSEVVSILHETVRKVGAKLGGVAPTANAFYFNPRRPFTTSAFIVGDLILIEPSPERFDLEFRLKEDYDFTAQHLSSYGCVARCNNILATFLHRTNAGGAVQARTSDLEQESIKRLRRKWPGVFRDNPKRPNEILMDCKEVLNDEEQGDVLSMF